MNIPTSQAQHHALKPPLYLIDGSGFIFRAFHALPPLTRPDGTPVGAVLGFCNMVFKLLQQNPGTAVAVIFDAGRHNFRNDIYAEYKANRSETPEDLIPQFPLMRDAARAFGLPTIEAEGYEADDLIATYARLACEEGRAVTIVSSDKDLMQLVNDRVSMQDPIKNTLIGRNEVIEKFGVPPEKVVDVQALAGDSIDNVPGVPGIGIKTAAQLINEFGDLETLLASTAQIKQPKRREALETHADNARISKKLVVLDAFAPVPVALDQLIFSELPIETLSAFLQAQGFKSLAARIGLPPVPVEQPAPSSIENASIQATDIAGSYHTINTLDALDSVIRRIRETGIVAVDTETTSLTPMRASLVGISLCAEAATAYYIPVGHGTKRDLLDASNDIIPQLQLADVMTRLKPILEDPAILKIGHNLKYDWQMFAKHGVEIAPADDTMLLSYTLDGTSHPNGLDDMAKNFCGHEMISFTSVVGSGKSQITFDQVAIDKATQYAAEDADYTFRLHQLFKPRLAREKMAALYEDIERPLSPVIARMEKEGIKLDRAFLQKLSHDFAVKIDLREKEIQELAGHPFNVASPKQLGVVLFDEMGLPGGSKTKTGDWSTAADILEDLAAQGHGFVEKILEWRQLSKLKSTYTDALQEQICAATGRVHTSFSMAGTSTGRLASSDPNLQNIPIRTEEGRSIRKAFIAEDGHVLVSIDYSQIELRLIAEMAGIAALKQAFRDGADIHTITASQVFGIPVDQVTSDIRRSAKAINFGIIYGISGYGLARQLNISPAEANQYIKQYYAKFPELAVFMENTKEEARRHGFVRTLYGRKCFIAGIADKSQARRAAAERQAINAPVQGTAADIMKLAMIRIDHFIRSQKIPARMLLQVHDELVFEMPADQVDYIVPQLKQIMETISSLDVTLTVESGTGLNWADAH